jgi:hypothetical protein
LEAVEKEGDVILQSAKKCKKVQKNVIAKDLGCGARSRKGRERLKECSIETPRLCLEKWHWMQKLTGSVIVAETRRFALDNVTPEEGPGSNSRSSAVNQ